MKRSIFLAVLLTVTTTVVMAQNVLDVWTYPH
jgi:hypothetical protein